VRSTQARHLVVPSNPQRNARYREKTQRVQEGREPRMEPTVFGELATIHDWEFTR
jgi:hypothetical protein